MAGRLITAFTSVSTLALAGCAGGTYGMTETSGINPAPPPQQATYGAPISDGVTTVPFGIHTSDYERRNHSRDQIGEVDLVGSPGVRQVNACTMMMPIYDNGGHDRNGNLINRKVIGRYEQRVPCTLGRYEARY